VDAKGPGVRGHGDGGRGRLVPMAGRACGIDGIVNGELATKNFPSMSKTWMRVPRRRRKCWSCTSGDAESEVELDGLVARVHPERASCVVCRVGDARMDVAVADVGVLRSTRLSVLGGHAIRREARLRRA